MQKVVISSKVVPFARTKRQIVVLCESEKRIGDVRVVDDEGRKVGIGLILMKTKINDKKKELKEYLRLSGYESLDEWIEDSIGRNWLHLIKLRRISSRKYSKKEEEFIRRYYEEKGARWVAEKLKRSVESVRGKAGRIKRETVRRVKLKFNEDKECWTCRCPFCGEEVVAKGRFPWAPPENVVCKCEHFKELGEEFDDIKLEYYCVFER